MVGLGRLELPTSRLSSARSNQLSYKPVKLPSSGACEAHACEAHGDRARRNIIQAERHSRMVFSREWSSQMTPLKNDGRPLARVRPKEREKKTAKSRQLGL
jgi:hypothetical protein